MFCVDCPYACTCVMDLSELIMAVMCVDGRRYRGAHWVVFLFAVFKNGGFLLTEIGFELNLLIKLQDITIINTLGSNKSSHLINDISKEFLCMIGPSSQRRGHFSIFTNMD